MRQEIAPAAEHRPAGTRTILYIEDNASNQELVRQILMDHPKISLLTAGAGPTGLELARQRHPDLIFLDLHLPGMMGIDVLKQLLEDPRTAEIPVVILTADATKHQTKQLLDAGAYAYLTKPFNVGEFLDILDGVFRESTMSPDRCILEEAVSAT